MRILFVDDDQKVVSFVSKGLKEAGFAVDHAPDGEEGFYLATTEDYDALIIDIMLPKLDGLTLIENLRGQNIDTPVIILSAKHTVDDRIMGLHKGGDDYLTKPFAFSELLARLQSLIRRSSGIAEPTSIIIGDLSIDFLTREVIRAGKTIILQPREFALLEYLMRNAGSIVSKTMIMEHVWDYDFDPRANVVEARMSKLRNKIDGPFEKKMIQTIHGVGYIIK
ncbi:MAG: response regulator transcription factor [Deltaproteobacteria bacterium]|nr:response regulator transcription factor [Deltaproteobacteria bacterium]